MSFRALSTIFDSRRPTAALATLRVASGGSKISDTARLEIRSARSRISCGHCGSGCYDDPTLAVRIRQGGKRKSPGQVRRPRLDNAQSVGSAAYAVDVC